jgi:hypothetical protein
LESDKAVAFHHSRSVSPWLQSPGLNDWHLFLDAKVDSKINDPKLIVLDFLASQADPDVDEEDQDLVVMNRFNRQTFHVYKTEPVDLFVDQIAPKEATTCLVHTADVLRTLFKVWAPAKRGKRAL